MARTDTIEGFIVGGVGTFFRLNGQFYCRKCCDTCIHTALLALDVNTPGTKPKRWYGHTDVSDQSYPRAVINCALCGEFIRDAT